ncbi:MAG: PKD domain-containing protein [Solirubrobacterales bacterium]
MTAQNHGVVPFAAGTGSSGALIGVASAMLGIGVTPDGATAYAVHHLDFAPDDLIPIDTATQSAGAPIPAGVDARGIAITPDGTTAYITTYEGNSVTPIDLATNTVGAPIPVGSSQVAIAIARDGATAYVTTFSGGSVTPIDLASGTAGTPIPLGSSTREIAIVPDQGPTTTAFDAAPAPAGRPTSFDASASSDPDGAVAAYEWDFGDGATATTASPTVQHTYEGPGPHTATLTVTDDEGCSTELIFTGQTAYCNGSPAARAAHELSAPPPPAACPTVSPSPTEFTPARRVGGRQVPGVRARIAVSAPAQLEIEAKLIYKRNGRTRTVSLGRHSLGNPGARNLRLPLPASLRKALPLGTAVRLTLEISATAGSGSPQVSETSVRTRVVKVLAPGV